jgi:hypothetical protein
MSRLFGRALPPNCTEPGARARRADLSPLFCFTSPNAHDRSSPTTQLLSPGDAAADIGISLFAAGGRNERSQMNSEALLSKNALRRACTLSMAFCVAMLATRAMALPEPKVAIQYSLEATDGGAYYQLITETPSGYGDADFVFDVADSGDSKVDVLVAGPLLVIIEFTTDENGDITDGPVELIHTEFEREWVITSSLTVVHTTLSTVLARKGTGTLSGSTITWENGEPGEAPPYQEYVEGLATCSDELGGFFCGFASAPWPQDQSGTFDVPLPKFTVLTDTVFGDSFISNNGTPGDGTKGTPGDRADDIDRPDPNAPPPPDPPDAIVKDTWVGIEVPEPSSEILLVAGVLVLGGLRRLREGRGAAALLANRR